MLKEIRKILKNPTPISTLIGLVLLIFILLIPSLFLYLYFSGLVKFPHPQSEPIVDDSDTKSEPIVDDSGDLEKNICLSKGKARYIEKKIKDKIDADIRKIKESETKNRVLKNAAIEELKDGKEKAFEENYNAMFCKSVGGVPTNKKHGKVSHNYIYTGGSAFNITVDCETDQHIYMGALQGKGKLHKVLDARLIADLTKKKPVVVIYGFPSRPIRRQGLRIKTLAELLKVHPVSCFYNR